MHHPTDRITHTIACVKPVLQHWLEREIAQWVENKERIKHHRIGFLLSFTEINRNHQNIF